MPTLMIKPDDTESQSFNRSLFCGELKQLNALDMEIPGGCGARDWRVLKPNTWPPWTRRLICQACGYRLDMEMPNEEKRW